MITARTRTETLLILAMLASTLSLAVALVAQYGFGLKPCELCMAQRAPYVVVIVVALLGLWKPQQAKWLLVVIALAFLVDGGIASYHTAVEKHWVKGPSSCTDTETQALQSLDTFLQKMQQAPIVACDQPQWEFHGITMAGMNAVWALLLAAGIFVATQQKRSGA